MTDKPAESAVERYETERRRNDYGNTCGAAMQVHRLADAAIAELLARIEELEGLPHEEWLRECIRQANKRADEAEDALVRAQQCHMYRLPVVAEDKETGEVGVHFIDGLSAAEVFAQIRQDYGEWVGYQSVDWTKDIAEKLAAAEAQVERLKEWETAIGRIWQLDGIGPKTLQSCIDSMSELITQETERAEAAEAEVERLKCCGNCKHLVTDTVQTRTIRIWAQVVLPRACTLQCGECDSDVTAWGRCMFTPSRWQRRQP